MWANVWFVIWPKQQDRDPERARHRGGQAGQPGGGRRGSAGRARLPHQRGVLDPDAVLHGRGQPLRHAPGRRSPGLVFWVVALAIMVLVEINALVGTPGKGAAKPLATVKGTLWFGFDPDPGLLPLVRDHEVDARPRAARPSGAEVGQQLGLGLVGQAGARARGGVVGHQVHRCAPEGSAPPRPRRRSARSGPRRACPSPRRSGPPRRPRAPGGRPPSRSTRDGRCRCP